MDLKDFNFWAIIAYLVPGFLMIQARCIAARGKPTPLSKDSLISFFIATVLYAFVLWLFGVALQSSASVSGLQPSVLVKFFFVTPLAVGFAFGLLERHGFVQRLFVRIGINVPLPISTAWDEIFSNMPVGTYLIVLLNDGTVYNAMVTRDSRFGSDAANADLYLGQTYSITDWTPYNPQRGVYIRGGELKSIEIIRP